MPFAYLTIKRQAALKLAQIIGADQASLEAAYAGSWATALDGAEIPISAFKDQILMIAKEIAQVIGNNPQDPNRSFLYGRSADLANLASIPTIDAAGVEWVGVFDSVADSATSEPLTLQPTQTLADTANSFFDDTELFNYSLIGNQLRHTRPLAYLQGCVWSEAAQAALYDSDGACPLPTAAANTLINGVCGNAGQIGWSNSNPEIMNALNLYQMGLQSMTGGPPSPLSSSDVVTG